MHSQYVSVLKVIQWMGYAISVAVGSIGASIVGQFGGAERGLMIFLVSAVGGCMATYLTTQGLISIVDLLNQIEANTKKFSKLIEEQKQ